MTAVQTLCSRAIFLSSGMILGNGPVDSVVNHYIGSASHTSLLFKHTNFDSAPGSETLRIKSASVRSDDFNAESFLINESVVLTFEIWCKDAFPLNLSLVFWTSANECAFNAVSEIKSIKNGLYRAICTIPPDFLNADTYTVDLYLVEDTSIIHHVEKNVLTFEMREGTRHGNWYGKWMGAVRPKFPFQIEPISPE